MAHDGRCARARRRRRRPRLIVRVRRARRRAPADGDAVKGRRRLRRLHLRKPRGLRAHPQPGAQLRLLHGLPPGTVAAAARALEIIATEPELVGLPCLRARSFTAALEQPAAQSAILPLVLGEASRTIEAGLALREAGFLVAAIRPPTVPAGTSRLRIAFSAEHTERDVLELAKAVRPIVSER